MILTGKYRLARVSGLSMVPTLQPRDWVIYDSTRLESELQGQIVVCEHPYEKRLIIKRDDHIVDSKNLFLVGDNPKDSTDSRTFGAVPLAKVKGVAVAHHLGRKR